MNKCLVFSFIFSAFADQSLYEAGISKVLDSLEQTVFSGNGAHTGEALGNSLYAQQLLKQKLASPSLDSNDAVFTQLETIFSNILVSMQTQTTEDQQKLDEIVDAFQHCDDAWSTTEGHGQFHSEHQTVVNAAYSDLATCRQTESTYIADANSKCSIFSTAATNQFNSDTNANDCASGVTSSDLIGDGAGLIDGATKNKYYNEWDAWFTSQKTHYDDDQVKTKGMSCYNAYVLWSNHNGVTGTSAPYESTSCGYKQTAYEEAFCAWRIQQIIRCGQNEWCHDYYTNKYNATQIQIGADNVQRLRDAAMITYVNCLVNQLRTGTTNITVDAMDTACNQLLTTPDQAGIGSYQVQYGNNFTEIPSRQHSDCSSESYNDNVNPTNPTTWHTHLLDNVNSGAGAVSGFIGPFRPPNEGLCSHTISYAARGEAYYTKVTDQAGNEYWHNESLVGATNTSLP